MHRLFVPPEWVRGDVVTLQGEVVHRVASVLRLVPGDEVVVLDNSGAEYTVRLDTLGRDNAEAKVMERATSKGEPDVRLTLYQGALKGEKFEWVLQKGTEVGIAAFVPLVCERSVPREVARWEATRYTRWSNVIRSAAEQSRRGKLPALASPVKFRQACESVKGQVALIPWEGEAHRGLREALAECREDAKANSKVALFIGPEGGFSEQEVECAKSQGVVPVTLGRRILRAETAGIVTAALVMYELGEMGPTYS